MLSRRNKTGRRVLPRQRTKIVCARILLAWLACSGGTIASHDGARAAPPVKVKISDLSDLTLGAWGGSGSLTGDDDVCVHNSSGAGTYNITATGSGAGGAFILSNSLQPGQQMPYLLYWNDTTGLAGRVALTAAQTLFGQTGASSNANCQGSGGLTANISIEVESSTLDAAAFGTYVGSLDILISPE